MKDFVSARAKALKPSGIRKFFDIVQTMEDAVSLGVGEPDFITPWYVRDAAIRSIKRGQTSYTGNRGLPKLRELICRYLKERFSVEATPERTVVTVGASEAIDLVLRAVCDEGDEVIVPSPGYVSYAPLISLCGARPVPVKCRAEDGFVLTPQLLEGAVTPKTKAVILAYPNNPTGAVMNKERLAALVPVFEKNDLLCISDEIYAELTYTGKHVSIASLGNMSARTAVIGGFSKAFAMTGWRVGYVCAPKEVDEAVFKIHQYAILCAPRVSQHVAVAALEEGFADGFAQVAQMREEYARRGRLLVNSLNALGMPCFPPSGAFYVFPSVAAFGLDGEAFASGLLKSERVAVVPGNAFGEGGEAHVRCSYATGEKQLYTAIERMERFICSLKK